MKHEETLSAKQLSKDQLSLKARRGLYKKTIEDFIASGKDAVIFDPPPTYINEASLYAGLKRNAEAMNADVEVTGLNRHVVLARKGAFDE